MPRPGLADRAARLDRMHEVDRRPREHARAPAAPRPARRSRNARTPPAATRAQHGRLGIALHRIQHVARETRRRRRARPRSTARAAGSAPAPPGAAKRPRHRRWRGGPERRAAERQDGVGAPERRDGAARAELGHRIGLSGKKGAPAAAPRPMRAGAAAGNEGALRARPADDDAPRPPRPLRA